ncbi:GntR family transcriptional regulator [Rhizobium oryzicola]|uniref:GntR family transcriptional regulator n=1 Tax=Rhizobium oryzicola TaxID=1232668 RepID=A0ABT8T0W2_9HYPH|nr:GntR family transcriptional regulator [Rhizobium oryzicola]MDO1583778.1 GntR family transcriptional regulator [Rhizobium oryzicola]
MNTLTSPATIPDSLSRQAYHVLENLIVTLKLAPGALVTEKQLIEAAGHGRTPVREAIQKLEWQGLIVVRPRIGLQITDIVASDYAEIMEVRKRLEPLAASLVAEHASAAQRQKMIECAKDMSGAAATSDIEAFLTADKRFDDLMEEACPNRFVTGALGALQTHSRRLWFSTASAEGMDRSVSLHVGIIRSIQNKDAAGAAAATEKLLHYLSELTP